MEGQEILKALATRCPNVALATETLTYAPTLNTRALQRLPLSLQGVDGSLKIWIHEGHEGAGRKGKSSSVNLVFLRVLRGSVEGECV